MSSVRVRNSLDTSHHALIIAFEENGNDRERLNPEIEGPRGQGLPVRRVAHCELGGDCILCGIFTGYIDNLAEQAPLLVGKMGKLVSNVAPLTNSHQAACTTTPDSADLPWGSWPISHSANLPITHCTNQPISIISSSPADAPVSYTPTYK